MSDEKFEEWAIMELFGHNRVAGKVSEATIGGHSFIRVDVPGPDGKPVMTKYYGQGSIYCMTPVAEDIARDAAKMFCPKPVTRWEMPALESDAQADDEPDEDTV